MTRLNLTAAVEIDAAAPDGTPRRTVSGVAVPYGVAARVADGTSVRFEQGALPVDGKAPKLFLYHDATQPVGVVTERVDTPEGMLFSARIAGTPAGDTALTLAQEGVLDSVSVGVNPTRYSYDDDGTMVITAADWIELSLVPVPAFAGSTVDSVNAAADMEIPAPAETIGNNDEETKEDPNVNETPAPAPAVVEASTVPVLHAEARRAFRMPSIGDYIAAMHRGGSDFAQLNANIRAAAGDVTTTDIPGELPLPVVQPVFSALVGRRGLIDAIGTRAMPQSGKIFIRPKITQHTSVAVQSTELSNVSATTLVVDDLQVTKGTYGGQATLSEQSIDWSSAELLNVVVEDLARVYANATENAVCDTFYNALTVSQKIPSIDFTDPESVVGGIYDAAADIATDYNRLPSAVMVSPTMWAKLGKLVDSTGRPVFPYMNPQNAGGTLAPNTFNGNPLGLSLVVSAGFDAANENIFVGDPSGLEVYEQQKGVISIQDVGTLGRTLAFRGYLATCVLEIGLFRYLTASA